MSKDLHGFFKPELSGYRDRIPKRVKAKKKRKQRIRSKNKYHDFLMFHATPKQFYKSKAWRELKERVYETYPRVCMCCRDSEAQMHVDHIQPRSRKPSLALTFSNLQVLCVDCNIEKSNIHAEDYREQAASDELDREMALRALDLGL